MKYWVYLDGEVPGCYLPGELAQLEGFGMTTLVCPAEGEISEKNWRRAGEIEELAVLVRQAESARKPAPPAVAAAPAPSVDVDALIDTSSQRLFNHVAELMKELEESRDEKALTASLQRQLAAYKTDLQAEREKYALAENRLSRLNELEEARRRDLELIAKLETSLRERDEALRQARAELDAVKAEHETGKRRLGDLANDLAVRNRLVDKLSKDLTEKELSLAKSLAVIRRLEQDLQRFGRTSRAAAAAAPVFSPVPEPAPEPPAPAPVPAVSPVIEPPPEAKTELSLPEAPPPSQPAAAPEAPAARTFTPRAWMRRSDATPIPKSGFTTDDPPPPPPTIEPPDPEKLGAQNALVDFFRRVMKKEKPEA